MNFFSRFAGLTKVLTVFVVLALVAAVALVFSKNDLQRTLTVDFTRTNSLYKGSDVRILGVAVGKVEQLKAKGDRVEVTLSYTPDVRLPADVKAVVISPAIVGDRFVQLAPAYSGGATLPDHAKLGVDRSEVPVELDEIFKSLDDLAVALGPKGANKNGSLSSLIKDTAKQFSGQGEQLRLTLTNFAKLSTTLSNNKEELFGSVREIEQFVELLQRNDTSVRSFFDSSARVAKVLEGERDELAKTLEYLSKALIDVRRLIKDNRTTLRHNIDNLQSLAKVLARHNKDIEHTLIDAPVALGNLGLAGGSSKTGTLDARSDLGETFGGILANPGDLPALLCNLLGDPLQPDEDICDTLVGILDSLLPANFAANSNAAALGDATKGGTGAEPGQDHPGPDGPVGGEAMTTFVTRTRVRFGILATVVAVALSGCGFSPYKLPLPGGADLGDHPYTVKVEFRDALDLVPQSGVRVNDVSVGKVTDITLKDWHAVVTVQINGDTRLPDDAEATIRQTSLLGEKFVSIESPKGGGTGRLSNGDLIPLERSGRNPELEEILSAQSLLFNGGGLEKTNTIVREFNKALEGNEPQIKELFKSSETFITVLDDNKAAILDALEKIDRLSVATLKQRKSINSALDDIPPALRILDSQRDELVRMLKAFDRLSSVATSVIRRSKSDTMKDLRRLGPVLRELANAGDSIANAFTLLTYPFPDSLFTGDSKAAARNEHCRVARPTR